MDKLFNCEEVADRYGVKAFTVWEWIRTGKLGACKIGKEYRISESHLREFEKAREVKTGTV